MKESASASASAPTPIEASGAGARKGPVLMAAYKDRFDTEQVAASLDDAVRAAAKLAQAPKKLLVAVVPEFLQNLYQHFVSAVLYHPPVGIVAVAAVTRLIWTGRIFRLYPKPRGSSKELVDEDIQRASAKRDGERLSGRSFILDVDDNNYNAFGGVERVRRRLCVLALSHLSAERLVAAAQEAAESPSPNTDYEDASLDKDHLLLEAAVSALAVSVPPGSARATLVQQMIEPVSRLEHTVSMMYDESQTSPRYPNYSSKVAAEDLHALVTVASMTAQVRAMDALLRVARDRLLKTTNRLARTRDHWKRRVKNFNNLRFIFKKIFKGTIEGDRLRLAYATAAYKAEVRRLGQVAALLMDRPDEMQESYLLEVLKTAEQERKVRKDKLSAARKEHFRNVTKYENMKANFKNMTNIDNVKENFQNIRNMDIRKMKMPRIPIAAVSTYSVRWNFDGQGFPLKILKVDVEDQDFGASARSTLMSAEGNDEWVDEARVWTQQARTGLCGILREALHGSVSTESFNEKAFDQLEQHWCSQQYAPDTDIRKQWQSILDYVDTLPAWRRVGEGRAVRLMDTALFGGIRRLDVFGIPSAMATVGAAHYVHKWAYPQWPTVKKDGIAIAKAVALVFRERFWAPVKGIWVDLMHKNEGMMSALSVQDEQISLDRMLRDLGFGDGSEAMRTEALQKAAETYEKDLKSGVFSSVFRGDLVRLMLVQVQQLKVGMLSALGTIDTLMKGNQIHFQALAAIPAIVIVTYGTRFFFRALYNIRSRDIRPISVAHAEMSGFLNNMEGIVLLADQGKAGGRNSNGGKDETSVVRTQLQPAELGELLLNMHRYLTLLDYGSPPFPDWMCDAIHSSLQDFLGGTLQRLGNDKHIAWLNLVQKKHHDLLKHV
jgi:nuclear-control-of-ATPase protein 2